MTKKKAGRPKYPFKLIMVSLKVPQHRKHDVLEYNKKIIKEELGKQR